MEKNMPKSYEPNQFEDKIYEFWQRGGYFEAKVDESKKPYVVSGENK